MNTFLPYCMYLSQEFLEGSSIGLPACPHGGPELHTASSAWRAGGGSPPHPAGDIDHPCFALRGLSREGNPKVSLNAVFEWQ